MDDGSTGPLVAGLLGHPERNVGPIGGGFDVEVEPNFIEPGPTERRDGLGIGAYHEAPREKLPEHCLALRVVFEHEHTHRFSFMVTALFVVAPNVATVLVTVGVQPSPR
jgi:hypothetical protein